MIITTSLLLLAPNSVDVKLHTPCVIYSQSSLFFITLTHSFAYYGVLTYFQGMKVSEMKR